MKKEMKELQKLKGIGEVLSQRLVEASYSTIAKVAAAEENGFKENSGHEPAKGTIDRNSSQGDDRYG